MANMGSCDRCKGKWHVSYSLKKKNSFRWGWVDLCKRCDTLTRRVRERRLKRR